MIIFAIENKVFFEAMQNKEGERNSLVSNSQPIYPLFLLILLII